MFFGTQEGCIRVFFLNSDDLLFKEVQSMKIIENTAVEKISLLKETIGCIKFKGLSELNLFKFDSNEKNIKFIGKISFDIEVMDFALVDRGKTNLLVLLENGLVLSIFNSRRSRIA